MTAVNHTDGGGGIPPLCGLETGIPKAPALAQANTPDLSLSLSGPRVRQSSQGQGGVNQIEPDSPPPQPGHPCQPTVTGRAEPSSPEEGKKRAG